MLEPCVISSFPLETSECDDHNYRATRQVAQEWKQVRTIRAACTFRLPHRDNLDGTLETGEEDIGGQEGYIRII